MKKPLLALPLVLLSLVCAVKVNAQMGVAGGIAAGVPPPAPGFFDTGNSIAQANVPSNDNTVLFPGLSSTKTTAYGTTGAIAKLGSITAGSGYTAGNIPLTFGSITGGTLYTPGVYLGVATTTSGAGTGLTANITVGASGAITGFTVVARGTGYAIADTISVSNAVVGGTGSGFSIPVNSVGYAAVPLTGGTGSGATANITISAGGAVTGVAVVNRGASYSPADSLSAAATNIGGTGSGFSVPVSTAGAASASVLGGNLWFIDAASGTCADAGTCVLNKFLTNLDNVDASLASNGLYGWFFNDAVGASSNGTRVAAEVNEVVQNTPAGGTFFTAIGTLAGTTVNLTGGASGAGNGVGDFSGFNPACSISVGNSIPFAHQCIGSEMDLLLSLGASVDQLIGVQVVQQASSQAPNQFATAFLGAIKTGASGFDWLLTDGAWDGNPGIKTTGGIFECMPHNNTGNCGTIGNGFDLNNYTAVSNFILRGPQANGNIDGAFNFNGPSTFVNGTVTPTMSAGKFFFGGVITSPTFGANGEGALYLISTNGAVLQGQGSTNDIVMMNKSGGLICNAATGGTSWACGTLQANSASALANARIGTTALTLAAGELGIDKITASGSAPGAAGIKLSAVCGTAAGSAKLVAIGGTSATAVTVLDNIGSGVTGC